jgi:DNA-binding NtrC family response regulator
MSSQNDGILCLVLNNLGNVYKYRGIWSLAIENYREALVICPTTSGVFAKRIQSNLAIVLQKTGRWNEAKDLLRESLHFFKRVKKPYFAKRTLLKLAKLNLDLGDYLEAERILYRNRYSWAKTQRQHCLLYEYRGILEIKRNNIDVAAKTLEEAVQIADGISRKSDIASETRRWLAVAVLARGEPEQAKTLAQEAKEIAGTIGEKYEEIQANVVLGRIEYELGNGTRASNHCELAYRLMGSNVDTLEAAELLDLRGDLHADPHGSTFDVPKAKDFYLQSVQLYRRFEVKARVQDVEEKLARLEETFGLFQQRKGRTRQANAEDLKFRLITRDRDLLDKIVTAAGSDIRVFIHGETGTGKELVARAIHDLSRRASKPLAVVDCAHVTEGLLASEFFGHERGAFTGAEVQREGIFQRANGGTLFLDEVGDLRPNLQGALLRAIQEKKIRPLGSDEYVPLDCRIISATNRDLKRKVEEGSFREDLYYRLVGYEIEVPPLRERAQDIPLLVQHFLLKYAGPSGKIWIPHEVMARFLAYSWPGNVRELESVIETLVTVVGDRELVREEDLPDKLHRSFTPQDERTLEEKLAAVERREIISALTRHKGNKVRAAASLGVTPKGLRLKMGRLAIDDRDIRPA